VAISVFDLFTVGIGPSSSHTVGPMRAAYLFVSRLHDTDRLARVASVRCELFGSLGATGHGHGSVPAVVLGLAGEQPHLVDPVEAEPIVAGVRAEGQLSLRGKHTVAFSVDDDVVLHRTRRLPFHSNGMVFTARDAAGETVERREYYSVGGGFVVDESETGDEAQRSSTPRDCQPVIREDATPVRHPFAGGDELVAIAREHGLRISDVVLANEASFRPEAQTRAGLLHLWAVMRECVERGTSTHGVLPGGLRVRRRAAELRRHLDAEGAGATDMDRVTLDALAVNEENAAGGRVVTAPTNGAAGIVPAVLHHAARTLPGFDDDAVVRFLLTAAAIGQLFKRNASISGAEVGCQGEVGSACSMAAGGFAELLGGTPEQVENAAEIGIEHNLGLTCDPVGGLVQIPCIERNAVASV
jgi:L-serine dehydratase